jgi:hypothetical protein
MSITTADDLNEICRQFNHDGVILRLISLDEHAMRVDLALDIADVECEECVMPTDYMERLVASTLHSRLDRTFTVKVHDPRVAHSGEGGPVGAIAAGDGQIVVLDPTAPRRHAHSDVSNPHPGPEAGGLLGKTVLFRVDVLWRSWDWVVDEWSELFESAGVNVLTWRRSQAVPGDEGERLQAEYELLVQSSDVLISGLGNCGSCTTWTIRDALTGLSREMSTVAVVTEHFLPLASILAEDQGYPALRIYALPYPLNSLAEATVRTIARDSFGSVLAVLGARV